MKWLKGNLSTAVAGAFAILILIADLLTPPGIGVWVFYLFPVALTYKASHHRAPFFLAGVCTTFMIVDFYLIPGTIPWPDIVNRLFGATLLWLAALVIVQRKRSEEALQHSFSLLSATLESTADGILVIGRDGNVVSYNQRFLNLWRIPQSIAESGDDNKLLSFVLDQLKEPEAFLAKVKLLYSKPGASSEDVVEFKDGRFFERHSQPQKLGEEIVGRVWSFRDVTERKRANEALTTERNTLRTLIDNLPDRIYAKDTEYRFILNNTAHMRALGAKTLDDILGKTDSDFRSRDLAAQSYADDQQVIQSGQPLLNREEPTALESGERGWILVSKVPLRDQQGKTMGLVGISRDITKRKVAEEALQKSESRYRSLFENMLDGFAYCKMIFEDDRPQDFIYLEVNNAFERWTGLKNVVGKRVTEVIPGIRESNPEWFEIFGRVALTGQPEKFEDYVAPLGIWLSISAYSSGKEYFAAVFDNITERKRVEKEIKDRELVLKESQRIGRVGSYDLDIRSEKWNSSEVLDEIFGIERQAEKSLASWNALVHPDQREEMLRYFLRDVVAAKQPFNKEYRIIRVRDGAVRWLWGTGELTYDETGAPVRMIGTIQDITERRHAEERLRHSEEQFRLISENVEDLIAVLDLEGRRVYNSPSYRQLLGDPNRFFGTDSFEEVHPDDRERIRAVFNEIVTTGIGQRTEYRFVSPDGSVRHIESQGSVIRGTDGKVRNVVVVSRDITVQKQVAEELRRAEEKYRGIFDGIPVGLYQSTLEGVYLAANNKMAEILGFESPEELIASTSDLHKEFYVKSGRRAEFIQRIRKEGVVYGFESQAYRMDRSIIWVSEDARALCDSKGVLVGFEGTTMDITSRKMAGESMRRLLQAVEQTHDVVFMTDLAGRIIYVNPAFEHTYGYTRDEAFGNTPRILKSGLQDAAFYARFWDTILSGQNILAELVNKTKVGQVVTMESTISPVFDSEVGLSGFIAVQRDVTSERKGEEERKGLEEQLFQAQKLESIGTLAGGIAHDFNNLLGIILGYSTILRRTVAENEDATKGFDAINNAVQRGADLVRQILMFARKGEASFMPFDVNSMITELKKMVEETFPKTITVSTNLDRQLPVIRADRSQMHQTLLNLFVNARDTMAEGGTLSISTTRATWDELREHVPDPMETDFIKISVSDTGTGMDEATRRKIFEPFFTTKEQGKGTGLGLAVVYGIIKSHNGHIDVKSAPGEGTTFNLYFPALTSLEQRSERPAEAPITEAGGKETILFIEDERMLRDLMRASLESRGYSIITAEDGAEAVTLFKKHHEEIALVISDLGLPKLDGTTVFNEFKKINPKVKVLIASGYVDPGVKSAFLKAGARGFIQKPYALPDILERVREALDAE